MEDEGDNDIETELRYEKLTADEVKGLLPKINANDSLETLYLDGLDLPVKELKGTATELGLAGKALGHISAIVIGYLISRNTVLKSLDLHTNVIGDEGAKAMADALSGNTSLTSLNLGYNSIGDEGAKAMADALRGNTSLTSLDLKLNYICLLYTSDAADD